MQALCCSLADLDSLSASNQPDYSTQVRHVRPRNISLVAVLYFQLNTSRLVITDISVENCSLSTTYNGDMIQ